MACDCLRHVNNGLAKLNAHVAVALMAPGADPQALVETHSHGADEVDTPYFLVATFCPFCGERYATAPPIGVDTAGEVSSHVH
ncbi:hypothetical protein [Caulobacter rhizosphaerae]|uniref:hypothetical protein n=1 Tax=Caulobacter rhizosphaerae TaxID=2010972 RepID=UPI0013D3BB32|nr:hypothetical protein [Caulobacter rhizosphaerae]GGL48122.1 hypothetical protein GCM10010983_51860 [Caulobacter rhizosphaerae]